MIKILRALLILPLALLPLFSHAGGGGDVRLEKVKIDLTDKESLQRGAKWFTNYCMGCHSAKFSRYERVADDLDIPHDAMMENLVFADKKIGELMDIAMPTELGKKWFGAAPPDLTLVARARNPDWLYTYLKTFYVDETRPLGVNNIVFPDVGMPHAMLELQGLQTCAKKDPDSGKCLEVEHVEGTGELTVAEYDQAVTDMVNFMEYIAEPIALERQELGKSVLIYILILFIVCWFLNREYWKGIH